MKTPWNPLKIRWRMGRARGSVPVREPVAPPEPVVVVLGNGRKALIRPLLPEDGARIREGLARLSAETRKQRFLGPLDHLTEEVIDYLVNPDLVDHIALGIEVLPEVPGEAALGIGVARSIRMDEDDLAEMAIVIADDWQGVGAGRALARELAVWSARAGMPRWLGLILSTNDAIRRLLDAVGRRVSSRAIGEGVTEVIYVVRPDISDISGDPAP